jgi:peptide/nickel transport system ATP-binding protein
MTTAPVLSLSNLTVNFGPTQVVRGVNIEVFAGEALGVVGESGCGKSVTWLAALGLLPKSAVVAGSVRFGDQELCNARRSTLEAVRGRRIAMIFQDPSSCLNPVLRVGQQLVEAVSLHTGLRGTAAKAEVLRLMDLIGIPDRHNRFALYPHEFSPVAPMCCWPTSRQRRSTRPFKRKFSISSPIYGARRAWPWS